MIMNVMNLHQVQMKEILGRDIFFIFVFFLDFYLILKYLDQNHQFLKDPVLQ